MNNCPHTINCLLCKKNEFKIISEIDSKSSTELLIGLCEHCGLIQQMLPPTSEELEVYYSQKYRVDYKQSYSPKPKHVYRASKTAKQRIGFLHESNIHAGDLLDVGAGGGEFTYLAQKNGFKSKGVEPNIGYSEYAKKEYSCHVSTGGLEDIQGKYDVITIFHVLEHLSSPIKAFEKLYSLLKENGVLFVEVPCIETNDASPHSIFFKAHLFYFSEATLTSSASQYFEVIKVDTTSNLKILFRAKKIPSTLELPNLSSVEATKKRMREKGWLEYLFKGNGLLKPMKKTVQLFKENKIKNLSGKQIVDSV
jgi:2-polyprenyl-3-methyl-5-hydroxy-6-metoxy-1,4-benzoquinol methylase